MIAVLVLGVGAAVIKMASIGFENIISKDRLGFNSHQFFLRLHSLRQIQAAIIKLWKTENLSEEKVNEKKKNTML